MEQWETVEQIHLASQVVGINTGWLDVKNTLCCHSSFQQKGNKYNFNETF